MPFDRWSLAAAKPITGYRRESRHIGDHLLMRRLDPGLSQKLTAKQLVTDGWSRRTWETNRHAIHIRFYPAIIAFLGYYPLPEASRWVAQ